MKSIIHSRLSTPKIALTSDYQLQRN